MTSKTLPISYIVFTSKEFVDTANTVPLHDRITTSEMDLDQYDDFTPFPGVPLDYSFQTPKGPATCQSSPGYDCMVEFLAESRRFKNTSRWENMTATECNHYWSQSARGGVIAVVDKPFKGRHVIPPTAYWSYLYSQPQLAISYCLVRKVPHRCRLQIHIWLLMTVIILSSIKICCMVLTLREQRGRPLMTLGDAISSFLEQPCSRSSGLCLHSGEDIGKILVARKHGASEERCLCEDPKIWQKKNLRYHSSTGFLYYLAHVMVYVSVFVALAHGVHFLTNSH